MARRWFWTRKVDLILGRFRLRLARWGEASGPGGSLCVRPLFLDGHDLRTGNSRIDGMRWRAILFGPSNGHFAVGRDRGRWSDDFRPRLQHRLEGIVSKRRDAPYRSGRRDEWRKTKCVQSDTFVVIGYEKTGGALASVRLAEDRDGSFGRLAALAPALVLRARET